MAMVCRRCGGMFSKEMNIEKIRGKEYHSYCAGVERKEHLKKTLLRQGVRFDDIWSPLFWFTIIFSFFGI